MLNHMEWRELEKMLREVLHEIGFDVELTRCSNDGGKNLIVFIEARSGLWSPRSDLDELLLEETFEPADAIFARR
jgi:hypothetical protein